MTGNPQISSRKADHIRINLEEDVQSGLETGLESYSFIHQALPEINLEDVDLSQTILHKQLRSPIIISSMTGGTPEALTINLILARAAQETGVAFAVGSQRAAIENPDLVYTYQVRKIAPDILIFANLGAVQLNYRYSIDECKRAVEMVEADGLYLHLNPLQEALQPEGDTCFAGLIRKIEEVCQKLQVPVFIKEVGWGISEEAARMLSSAGVTGIDVAGAGGTSWSQVEMYRNSNTDSARVAASFRLWGIPTAESIQMVRNTAPNLILFASGGIKDGIDIGKCIALGARAVGLAGEFLKAASISSDAVINLIHRISRELQICMFATGTANLDQLAKTRIIRRNYKK